MLARPEARRIAATKNLSCGAAPDNKHMGTLRKMGFSDAATKSRA
jgi:hypothetical protein